MNKQYLKTVEEQIRPKIQDLEDHLVCKSSYFHWKISFLMICNLAILFFFRLAPSSGRNRKFQVDIRNQRTRKPPWAKFEKI